MKRKNEYLSIRDPVERKKKEWTQSDVFYATRKLLVAEYGYTDQEVNREHITGSIRDECAKLGVTREQIGIIAANRAQLYFRGKWTDVGLDEIEEQVEYGTDMVMVEKEGIVSQINLFANGKAIALLNTRGFFVEYASKLAKLADERGCNVSLLVDWDVSGLLIFLKVRRIIPGVKRIGVDFKTLEDLGLRAADVEEKYTPDKGHLKSLKKELAEAIELAHRKFGPESTMEIEEYAYIKMNLDYLEEKRIEINSIVSELNDNARFWNWVEEQLRDCFPERDFTRSVNIPDYVEPGPLQKLNDKIRQKGMAVLKSRKEELEDKLSKNNIENAFLFDRTNKVQQLANYGISDYEKAVTRQSQKIIENSDEVKPYLEKVKELLKQAESEDNKKNTNNKSNEDTNQN
jgi:5S rRNA maturation endonuclease (ribonuclease M5)